MEFPPSCTFTAAKLAVRFAQMRILFTSGYSAAGDTVPAEGPTGRYLQKPYSPTALAHLVREILDEPLPADSSA